MNAEAKDKVKADVKAGDAVRADMVNIEVDGVAMQAPKGSMIIQATDKAGVEIPRFCYHSKLSIAANCRMCLVDVEKAPKPMPACATPVMEGMKVFTQSRRAIDAQHGVMEFLLINHPLDCPICDQGGECELQDLAMGYGRSVSRFSERKRVVKDKNVGPLVQTEMTRCIHCTRCVRFLEEIAGTTEMGGTGRGDRLEIGTCVENSIDSELSGNIIDLCPVGALTDKPFRFAARAWELTAKPSCSAHDGVGSAVYHHVRNGKILRTVPRENESRNETWLADRDRYSHAGLYAADRATQPMLKVNGEWKTVPWAQALTAAVEMLGAAGGQPGELAALMSPSATTEEYYLGQKLVRGLGSNHIDHRLREADFADDSMRPNAPVFGMKIAAVEHADAILLVGCNPRHEAPILGHRLRKAWKHHADIDVINPLDWEFVFDTREKIVVAPQYLVQELAAVAAALKVITGDATGEQPAAGIARLIDAANVEPRHKEIAGRLRAADRGLVLLGQFAMSHGQASALRQLADWIARASTSALNLLPHGANPVGAWMAGAVPHRGPAGGQQPAGHDRRKMVENPGKAMLLWDFEPEFDVDDPAGTMSNLRRIDKIIAVSSFASGGLKEVADVILPLAPLAESEGSLVNLDGESISFAPATKVSGEARPGWKILRKLGEELGLDGFGHVDLNELQQEMHKAFPFVGQLVADQDAAAPAVAVPAASTDGLHRIGEVPMYSVDALCRRAPALQQTVHAESQFVGLSQQDASRLGLANGDRVNVRQGDGRAEVSVRISAQVPEGAAWVRAATCSARDLGSATGPISVEVA